MTAPRAGKGSNQYQTRGAPQTADRIGMKEVASAVGVTTSRPVTGAVTDRAVTDPKRNFRKFPPTVDEADELLDRFVGDPDVPQSLWTALARLAGNEDVTVDQFRRIDGICQNDAYQKSGCWRFDSDDPVQQMCLNPSCPPSIVDLWVRDRVENPKFVRALARNLGWGTRYSRDNNPLGLPDEFFTERDARVADAEFREAMQEVADDNTPIERVRELVDHPSPLVSVNAAIRAWTADGLTTEQIQEWVDAGVHLRAVPYAYRWWKSGVTDPHEAAARNADGEVPPPLPST